MQVLGRELNITKGSFGEVMALKKAVADAAVKNGIKIDLGSFEAIMDQEVGDVGSIVEIVLNLATDESVRECLFTLGKRCTLGTGENKARVDQDYFEDPKNWEYYYPTMVQIARDNLAPFFKFLNGRSSALEKLMKKSPRLKSQLQ